ncbi:Ig-like domain-containing protein [Microbacterium gilvum]|uniref:SbsA Ig-like domain-containing protein n=1 Tax=Microbacterium gilvum TaxID=1336204 RepID=A0ABP9A1I5_9MICO
MSTEDRPLSRRELRERAAAANATVPPDTSEPPAAWAVPPADTSAVPPPVVERGARGRESSSRGSDDARRPRGRFLAAVLAVVGVLAVLAAGGAALSLAQGPRVSSVQVDPAAAVEVSGSRVVLTANQALAAIDPAQVSVTPETPFTVDASGRMVGVRFTVPLDDATEYTIAIDGAESVGGGPAATLEASFTTPAAEILLLQRGADGEDTIFRSDLSGESAVPVYSAETIDDFRATSDRIVVSVREDDVSHLLVLDRDGGDAREIPLPGEGDVTGLQVSAQGRLAGFTYTDHGLSETEGRASVLFTVALDDADAEPVPLVVADEEPSIASWRFVPDSTALLYVDFAGDLVIYDPQADDPSPTVLGQAMSIDAVTRGTYTAFVERLDAAGGVQLDLTTGDETALVAPADDLGQAGRVLPVPGGGTVREFVTFGADGVPTSQTVAFVDDEGAATPLFEATGADGLLQTCVSPSGRYIAALVAPDLTTNPYGYDALQPLPATVRTHIVEIATGETVSTLDGFDISWCDVGPWDGVSA